MMLSTGTIQEETVAPLKGVMSRIAVPVSRLEGTFCGRDSHA
jgi:hypothetical protein